MSTVTPNDISACPKSTDLLFRGHSGSFGIPVTAWPFTGDAQKDEPINTALAYLTSREGDPFYGYMEGNLARLSLPFCSTMTVGDFLDLWRFPEGRMILSMLFELYAGYGGEFTIDELCIITGAAPSTWTYRVTQTLGEFQVVENGGFKTRLEAWAEALVAVDRLLYMRGSKNVTIAEPVTWYDNSLEDMSLTA